MIKGILFIDLDHTLIKNPFHSAVFPEISATLSDMARLDREIVMEMILKEAREREKNGGIDAYDWDEIIKVVESRIGVEANLDVEKIIISYCEDPYISLLPNARYTLETLRKKDFRIYAVSNGFLKYQKPVMEALNIVPLFDDIITPDKTGYIKSNKKFYEEYLVEGVPVVCIGDSPKYDVYYPKKFGYLSIWVVSQLPEIKKDLYNLSPIERIRSIRDQPNVELGLYPDAIVLDISELPLALTIILDEVSKVRNKLR